MRTLLACVCLACFTFAGLCQSNEFYRTVMYKPSTDNGLHSQKLEQMMEMLESRPAKADPEGNWGLVKDGLQLSVRLETNRILVGRTAEVRIILRNVGSNIVQYGSVGRGGATFFL